MAEAGLIVDVNEQDFDRLVIAASNQRPVIVDFWAAWCAPCRMLGPTLERVVTSLAGRATLAKVNVDQNQRLAAQWRVQSIPSVKVFKGGKLVTQFVGAMPEADIRRLIAPFIPSELDELIAEADRLLADGKPQLAERKYRRALESDPNHFHATVRLAEAALNRGDAVEATSLSEKAAQQRPRDSELEALQGRLWFADKCKDSGLLDACRLRLADNPEDLTAKFYMGCCLAIGGKYQEALEEFLAIVRADKGHDDGAAKEAMLRVFAILGPDNELASRYRPLLSRELFV